ncbi:hypothetical protein HPB50_024777 [Hyalomma asiaticum]|uniref:Uncharacterized protein n=1 Tax=Hyalomma asiaticum TaxID=266040 RepID=A0ACB7T9S3_HYAAI|nr:hypothetical protein HPB50_024777 [Hyalomma asiaticum]
MADKGSRKTTQSPGTTREARTRNAPTYQNRTHKFATLFVMTAGSANATQFPTMFIYYGGAPFLLAYLTFLGCVAFPILRLESNLVQFVGDGNRGIFSTVPLFIGLGYSMTVYALVHAVADTVQLSDALSLLLSWTKSFDWHHECPGGWMTRNFSCQAVRRGSIPCKLARDRIAEIFRRTVRTEGVPLAGKDVVKLVPMSSYEQFVNDGCIPDLENTAPPYDFRRQPIWEHTSYDVTRAGPAFAIAAIWLLVFAIAHRGFLRLKTCFYAFVLLHVASTLMLLVRASTLTGAARGLRVLMLSNWSSVTNLEMWSRALYASLESVGVTGTIYIGIERLSCFKNRFQQ